MGDKTEWIRSELDKRGIDWWCGDGSECSTLWVSNGITWEYAVQYDGEPNWMSSLEACEYNITPEQAIQATLGLETCKAEWHENGWGTRTRHCGKCGADLDCDTRNSQNYCPNCGAKMVSE